MRSLSGIILLCFMAGACSQNKTENRQSGIDYSALTLDSVGAFSYRQFLTLDSTARRGHFFAGTRQEFWRSDGWIKVSLASSKNPESGRTNLPKRWITSHGLYAGMPIDSFERINQVPFYLQLVDNKLEIVNWEGGALTNKGVKVDFIIEQGGKPNAFMSSRDLIEKGWIVRCATLTFYLYDWNEPEQPCLGYPGNYSYISLKALTPAEVDSIDIQDLRLMRNEVFARHGYIFKSDDLKEYFAAKPWYEARYENVDAQLSEIEKANVTLLKAREIHNRYSPIGILVRQLSYLTLPIDLEDDQSIPSALADPGTPTPDGSGGRWSRVNIHGLLPDTTRIFAVLWSGTEIINSVESTTVLITTFDKNLNRLETAVIRLSDAEMSDQSGCELVGETSSSMLDEDWSYRSVYEADLNCPTAGADLRTTHSKELSGRIEADGKITTEGIQIYP